MTNIKNPNPKSQPKKRCEIKSFELIYENISKDCNQKELIKKLCNKRYGVYKAFSTIHIEDDDPHIHIGVILRDKPRALYWSELSDYFNIEGLKLVQHGPLKNKSKNFNKKLQTYYDYTVDQSQHEGQTILPSYLYKFTPQTVMQKIGEEVYINKLILEGLSIEAFNNILFNEDEPQSLKIHILKHYDAKIKMIQNLIKAKASIDALKIKRERENKYMPHQKKMKNILETQDDRKIDFIIEPKPEGKGGKSYFCKTEALSADTLFLTNAKTQNIALSFNPQQHKKIIFNIPKNDMINLNYRAIESLKDGLIYSQKYESQSKIATFNPKIIICGNEYPTNNWTQDRVRVYKLDKNLNLDEFQL